MKPRTLFAIGSLCLALTFQARAALFTIDTSIGPSNTNYDGQDIVVIGCTVTIDGFHNFSDLVIIENGTVTHSPITNLDGGGLNLTVTNNVVVEAGSAINANGLGFGPGLGAGAGLSENQLQDGFFYTSGGGGGFGGFGGSSFGGVPGGYPYDSVESATNAGSGGGAGFGSGGAGGGLVNLAIGGALVLDGQISASGANGVNLASGGGSGGGISISAPSVSGDGSINASGGMGEISDGGGGGGGRIALFFTTNDFTGTVSASGGLGAETGGAGTIDLQSESGFGDQILVDNGGASGADTPLIVPASCNLTISGGAMAYFSNAAPAFSISNLLVGSNSWLMLGPAQSSLNLTVRSNATIQSGGGISAAALITSKVGNYGATYYTNGDTFGGGGGNGGSGGAGFGASGGAANTGSITEPATTGSVGGIGSGNSPYNAGGPGGGSIDLTVEGTLTLNGVITANGGPGLGDGSGGGSGGSVYLILGKLAGAGAITANGGAAGSSEGGGGGGGRIAIHAGTNQFSGSVSAVGGSGLVNGGAGTIWLALLNNGQGQLLLDNGGVSGASTPVNQGLVAGFSLTVTDGAIMVETSSIGEPGNVVVGSNSFIMQTNGTGTFNVLSNVTVAAGGGILVTAYSTSSGPEETGGSYGGYGGPGAAGLSPTSPPYGSLQAPISNGSRGGSGPYGTLGGYGGGALNLSVRGTLLLNGTMSVNGMAALPNSGAGGGSGGSLYVTTGGFSGSGSLSANGGAGSLPTGGGGSGGRVSVYASSNNFSGSISAYGAPGYVGGGAGTIYITTNGGSLGLVIADNGGIMGTNTPFSTLPTCDLTVANGAVAAFSTTAVNVRNLLVASNSFIVPTLPSDPFNFTVTGNATILPMGGIITDGEGSAAGGGVAPGATTTSNTITTGGGGGGSGGFGGNSALGSKGGGSYSYMAAYGSGGGAGSGENPKNVGGAGGGNLTLSVSGILTLGGQLSANGTMGPGEGSGGGGGGSISVHASTILGNGSMTANGGAGQLPYGGGGGGGEITMTTTNGQFTGSISAHGGVGATAGGAGIVIEQLTLQGVEQVIMDNGGLSGTNTPFSGVATIYDWTVTNGAIAAIYPSLQSYGRNMVIGSNSFVVGGGSYTTLNTSYTVNLTGNAAILPTGGMIFDGAGNANNAGSGAGKSAGNDASASGSGGGYGGNGGASASGAPGGVTYGSIYSPESTGSGGGNNNQPLNVGGLGGGSLQLSVTGALALGGKLSANGTTGVAQGGGGSGGSILLRAGTLTGSGSITANGGAGQLPGGGGGGGGRISVITPSNQFTGPMMAQGGAGFANGGAGTVYIAPNSAPVNSQLILNNGGLPGALTPLMPQAVPNETGLSLVIQGGAVVGFSAETTITGLLVGSNSFYVQTNHAQMYLNITSNVTVQAGGGIIVDGTGNGAGGVGSGGTTLSPLGYVTGGGGGHGGYGGNGEGGAPGGNVYDQFAGPILLGGGGGAGAGVIAASAPGGGALELMINGTFQMDGLVSANGAVPTSEAGGGGAGGSIYVTVGVLAGAGSFTANGAPGDLPNGGGGGGGRIALRYSTNLFTGALQARGGAGFVGGGAGTISLAGKNGSPNALIVDNGGLSGTNTPISTPTPYDLTISGAAIVVPQSSNSDLFFDSLLVESNATLSCPSGAGNNYVTVLSNATVQSTASISLDGQGYNAGAPGPGAGTAGTNGIGSGGGHGGMGGAGAFGVPGGGTYDSLQAPSLAGSAGGVATTMDTNLSQGGGAIEVTVGKTFTINGTISADGDAAIYSGAGGGAGGSIFLRVGLLAGNGILRANGGAGQGNLGGGGGGGRIALSFGTNQFAGTTTVSGGAGFAAGQTGTLFLVTNLNGPIALTAPPVPISAVVESQSGNLVLQWSGLGGMPCQVQSSSDLVHWQPVGGAILSSNGANTLILPVGGDPGTFFRLVPCQ